MARRGETLELAVLGLLHESPMHGYELRKQLNAVLGWGRVLSYGSLYPALKKMLRAGWIAEHVEGTPAGVGVFRKPPVFLKPGDTVTLEIERVGRLENPVMAEA